eukprot:936443-Pelagomonas_calceolata.AAC.2
MASAGAPCVEDARDDGLGHDIIIGTPCSSAVGSWSLPTICQWGPGPLQGSAEGMVEGRRGECAQIYCKLKLVSSQC